MKWNGALRRTSACLLLVILALSPFVNAQDSALRRQHLLRHLRGDRSSRRLYSAKARDKGKLLADSYNSGPFDRSWPSTIAVCVLIKEEDDQDIEEFIKYHRYVGVDTFYIRENGRSSQSDALLKPYIQQGFVNFGLKPGPKHPTQTNWFNECGNLASEKHAWVAFIDMDEFMVVLNKRKAVTTRNALKHMLTASPARFASSISMQWVLFGSAGNIDRPVDGQLKGYNKCTGQLSRQMKCIGSSFWLHPAAAFQPMHVHQCFFREGAASLLGNMDPLPMWLSRLTPISKEHGASHLAHLTEQLHRSYTDITDDYQLVLFHYVTRYAKYFLKRKIGRRSGKFATAFASQKEEADEEGLEADLQHLKDFEREHGFDGEHDICAEGGALADAMLAARANGWSELEATDSDALPS